jgi:hypothetical protein
MLERAEMVKHSLHFVDTSDDWILGADMFGIQTHYRKCEDDENAIIVKIEGTMDDLPLFEQMAVIHEIDLFKEWAPFCTDSVLVDKVGKAELYGYVIFLLGRALSLILTLFLRLVVMCAGTSAWACQSSVGTCLCTRSARTACTSTARW